MSNNSEEMDIEERDDTPLPTTKTEPMRILEALLFASDELLTPARIKAILPDNPDVRAIRKMADAINMQLQQERHPFEVVELGGGYQIRTISFYQPWVSQLFKEKSAKKLSLQALECLAIVAYKQPLTKTDIEEIRGVVSDGAIKTLLEKHLVTICGRSDKAGRPLLYGTTNEFLRYFGFNRLSDLPRLEEFEQIAKEKMEELGSDDLLREDAEMDAAATEVRLAHNAPAEELVSVVEEGEAVESESEPESDSEIDGEGLASEYLSPVNGKLD